MAQPSLSQALTAEFVGTFALVFVGAGAGAIGAGGLVGVALAHGLTVLAFAYAFGHLSGTHVNPAVTVGVWAAGRMAAGRALSYVVFQCMGGVAAALALRWVLGGATSGLGRGALAANVTPGAGWFLEALLAFFLVTVVLNAAISGKAGDLAGVAIGFTLTLNILVGGPLTGAIFNPARALGPMVATGDFTQMALYLIAPLVGGAAAAALYRGVLDR
ncbi:MAG: aquaporin [Thermoanaerobaculia bacterium]